MRTPPRTRGNTEGGFALLIVFLLAAAVAFTMYLELPRAAFESARDKEQLLMDRGNQYKRAIEVFYAVNKRYPPELKDLENTNEKRYLRHRYKDPLTGEDEWRLIHSNGSFLTDSLATKPPAQNAANGTPANAPGVGAGPLGANTLNTAPAAVDANANNGSGAEGAPVAVNPAVLRRPSDRPFTPAGGVPQPGNPQAANAFGANPFGANSPGANQPGAFDPNDPRTWPAITLGASAQQNLRQPGQPLNGQITPGPGGGFGGAPFAGQPFISGQPPGPSGSNGPGFNGQGSNGNVQVQAAGGNPQAAFFDPQNPAGNSPNPFNANQPGVNQNNVSQGGQPQAFNSGQPFNAGAGFNQPFNQPINQPFNQQQFNQPQAGQFPQRGSNPAQPQIGVAIPAGQPNPALQAINNQLFRPTQAGPAAGVANAQPGIAGVASKHEGPSIKSYRERTKYQEWEFVFDPATKGPNQANPNQANPNQPGQGQAGQGLQGQGQPGQGQPGQGLPGPGQPGTPNPFGLPIGQPSGQPTGQPFGQPTGQPFGLPAGPGR